MMDFSHVSPRWSLDPFGIYRGETGESVSYPTDGNGSCFKIEDASFWFHHRNAITVSLVQHFSPRPVFYDVGGGNGCVTKRLQDAGIDCVLVEPGAEGVANARLRGVTHVVQSMWSPEIVRPESAEAIGLFDVVEHIQDDIGFLNGVHQTLAPNGLVFITVPALHSLWSYEDVYAGHFRRYRLGELQRLLIKTGFKVEYSSYFFSMLPLPIFALRSVPSFLGWRKAPDSESIRNEHTAAKGFAGRMMDRWLQWEQGRVAALKSIFTGSSCVIVGRKV
jgi:SAM-dependent methyltransferase